MLCSHSELHPGRKYGIIEPLPERTDWHRPASYLQPDDVMIEVDPTVNRALFDIAGFWREVGVLNRCDVRHRNARLWRHPDCGYLCDQGERASTPFALSRLGTMLNVGAATLL